MKKIFMVLNFCLNCNEKVKYKISDGTWQNKLIKKEKF